MMVYKKIDKIKELGKSVSKNEINPEITRFYSTGKKLVTTDSFRLNEIDTDLPQGYYRYDKETKQLVADDTNPNYNNPDKKLGAYPDYQQLFKNIKDREANITFNVDEIKNYIKDIKEKIKNKELNKYQEKVVEIETIDGDKIQLNAEFLLDTLSLQGDNYSVRINENLNRPVLFNNKDGDVSLIMPMNIDQRNNILKVKEKEIEEEVKFKNE